jgi:hypothetical protein
VVIFGSATADAGMRAMVISVPLHLVRGKGVHRGKLFPKYCRGLGASQNLKIYPSVKSAASSKRCRRQTIRPTAIILRSCFAQNEATSDNNLNSEKFTMAELRRIEFLACGRISMLSAYPFVTTANDF